MTAGSANFSQPSEAPAWRLGVALLIAPLPALLLALLPVLLVKSDERMLAISRSGIATTIGKQSAEIPWTKIARIEPGERCTFIFGRSGNSFAIPHRAFPDEGARAEFVEHAIRWWSEARAR